jgi:hypothetical protein
MISSFQHTTRTDYLSEHSSEILQKDVYAERRVLSSIPIRLGRRSLGVVRGSEVVNRTSFVVHSLSASSSFSQNHPLQSSRPSEEDGAQAQGPREEAQEGHPRQHPPPWYVITHASGSEFCSYL